MSSKGSVLIFGEADDEGQRLLARLQDEHEVSHAESLTDGLQKLQGGAFDSVVILGHAKALSTALLIEAGGVLEQLPDGLAMIDQTLGIVWCNRRLEEMTCHEESLVGTTFYDAFGHPEILGPDFCPFNTALATGHSARSHLRVGEKDYFEVHARPVDASSNESVDLLIVSVRDVSAEVQQRQKLNAIYQAGIELGDLSPQEVLEMSVEERVELLKSKILHYTQDLLEFETVEIRLLEKESKRLEPLLSVGMQPEAEERRLTADPQGNGVTGFVAATGKSYLCEDIENDPLYITGAEGARSSLTVPLVLHDEVFGTFNVESPGPCAFDENDLQFLELFSHEVAVALNTLELLVAEKMTTASQSTEMILREIANPADEILNDAAWILERYIGHEPAVCERLQRILGHTRTIRQMIHRVGESIAPRSAFVSFSDRAQRPRLRDKRILVVDADDAIRTAAHELLGRFSCAVETAHNGEEAFLMARSFHYDCVLVDIRLPDMTGYDCFVQLRKIHSHLPIILMTGFGYDPTHSIVKARQHGGLKAVLYKPFRLDQLLKEVEEAACGSDDSEAEVGENAIGDSVPSAER